MEELQKAITLLETNNFRPDHLNMPNKRDFSYTFLGECPRYDLVVKLMGNLMWSIEARPVYRLSITAEQAAEIARQIANAPALPGKMVLGREQPPHELKGEWASNLEFALGLLKNAEA